MTADMPAALGIDDVYRTEYRSLVRLAAVLLGDRASAEEAVQDAFAAVHARLRKTPLNEPERLLSYVRSAVMNNARSHLRRRKVAAAYPWRRAEEGSLSSAEEDALVGARRAEMVRVLRTLPTRQRECLTLRYYLHLSDSEVAETLGLAPGSVKTHIFRGLAALRQKLEDPHAD